MNIIIPLGGLGNRFKDEQYSMPKPLIKVLGKNLIFQLLDRLILQPDDNVYMIIGKELEKFNFTDTIHSKYPNVRILYLDKQTEGAVETVLIGLNQVEDIAIKKARKTILLDCDNFYTIDILHLYRDINEEGGCNAIICFHDNQSNPIYSYLRIDPDSKLIVEIKEKVRISDYANTGCYCFNDIATLKKYCSLIIEKNIRQKDEYYMSVLVQRMIEDGHPWMAIEIPSEDYHCLGTPFQLKLYCNQNLLGAEKKRICFDLDSTLVTIPTCKNDYSTVRPIIRNIEYLRFLKKIGHTIIIYTARRMKTHSGNIGKVVQDIGKTTLNTLDKFDIPYDELYFGKPYADFYIDDLAVNANFDLEKELGIYKTTIQERSFNEISSSKIEVITKRSQTSKIKGEIFWYRNTPVPLRDFFPALIATGNDYYVIEKINGITFSYLFVNESLSPAILNKFLEVMHKIHLFPLESPNPNINIYSNYREKLEERYKNYDYSKLEVTIGVKEDNGIYERLKEGLIEYEKTNQGMRGIIHGDPVFSNVLIDNHNNIKLIDMRGLLGNELTLEGDIFYDYAKIYQSLLGYDEILLDKVVSTKYKKILIDTFISFVESKYPIGIMKRIALLTDSLLFTLIPLHDNEKCKDYYKLIGNYKSHRIPDSSKNED